MIRRALTFLVLLVLLPVGVALGYASRPAAVSPRQGATLPKRTPIKFTVRDSFKPGPGKSVWVTVSASKKVRRDGTLKNRVDFGRAKRLRKGSTLFRYTAKFYDYPEFYMNRPGRYYWQPHRIDCAQKDCRIEGKIRSFFIGG